MEQIGFKCNRGAVRENNEDACFVIPSQDVYIVADGVGGNNSGEVASRTAVGDIAAYVNEHNISQYRDPDDVFAFMEDALSHANENILKLSQEGSRYRGMATTVVMVYFNRGEGYIANIGDSRAYLYRDGQLVKVTKDHTYVNELVDKGVITKDEAENHQQKNVITKALGADRFVEPDFYKIGLHKDDIIMLCSDGLYGEVSDEEIAAIIAEGNNMNDTCARLVDAAIVSGGRDNITVVCVKI